MSTSQKRRVTVRGYALAAFIGLAVYLTAFQRPLLTAATMKTIGRSDCPWASLAAMPWNAARFHSLVEQYQESVRHIGDEPSLAIEHYSTPTRPFWIASGGEDMQGSKLLAWLLAEQDWLIELGRPRVMSGDVVVDVGAHIGTFTAHALAAGAANVIMIEPDPRNVECLRRNFAKEIASGRAILIPAGAWSSEKSMEFSRGLANSGTGSMVRREIGAQTVNIPVRPIDAILADLGVKRVNLIKMDIEGAEREALRGAFQTLHDSKPSVMLDAYHLSDDSSVIPSIILAANSTYKLRCGPCAVPAGHYGGIPYSLYFH